MTFPDRSLFFPAEGEENRLTRLSSRVRGTPVSTEAEGVFATSTKQETTPRTVRV